MAIRALKCPTCSASLQVLSEKRITALKLSILHLKCGHDITEKLIINEFPDGRDAVWLKAYPFQQRGVEFLERSNFNSLIADEMGLGKTIQALLALRYNWKQLTPCIITCKASLTYNWLREYFKWVCSDDPTAPFEAIGQNGESFKIPPDKMPYLYNDGTLPLIPGYQIYIIPMSLLARPEVLKVIREKIKPQLIIGDEVHNFKSTRAQRTQSLYDILDGVEIDADKRIIKQHWRIPHRIMLSGTPVVNRLFEYFPILNIIKPNLFSNIKRFAAEWVDYDPQTKRWMGLKAWKKDSFFKMTSSFIIRRTRDILDLPPRMPDSFIYTDDFAPDYARLYNKALDELEEIIENEKNQANAGDMILGIMSRLRHIAGLLKVRAATAWAQEMLENTDEKLLIGCHHRDIVSLLSSALAQWNPITITGSDDALAKDKKVQSTKLSINRLVIGNIEACGEGINGLQETINNCLILERGWSPSREEQFIGRLDRPGQKLSVFVTFLIAARTLDDFFTELLKFKKNIVTDATTGEFILDRETMKALALKVIAARLRIVGV
jgi:SNF2 family DNA or RNA helicase